jgi:8-oxo-dGTP diphosphatase
MNRPGVGIGVFIVRNHKFLMIKRRGAHGSGTWSVPGGWMEYSESFEQTAMREAKEEVGVKIKNVKVVGVTNSIFKEEKIHSITVWVVGEMKDGKPKIMEPEKISALEWTDLDSLPSPLFLPWEELLKSEFIAKIKNQLNA